MNIELKNLDNLTESEKKTLEILIEKANKTSCVFKPTGGEEYYFTNSNGGILSARSDECPKLDNLRFQLGNCFETEEQAEFALEKQKVYTELKRYALEHNECAIDWGNSLQAKWYIQYNCDSNEFEFLFGYKMQLMGVIYFTNEEIAQNAIAEIGEKTMKKYLFEVGNND